ncbi:MAG TPA: outer membrane beta-barrel protein [Chitinophagaceae bacterium]|nr:outer membrane beta-barrel protein [Chitinophagaceae bacterium]
MKKLFLLFVSCLVIGSLFAQETPETPKKKKPINLTGRVNDHVLVQFGYTGWNGVPDTVSQGGFSHSFNAYFMFDFPIKTSPKFSIGIGAGIGSDHIKFDKTYVGIKENSKTLQFINQVDTSHFKRTKLATAYVEAPIEFRYTSNPMNSDQSFKFALGIKVGALINAHTRNKDLQSESGGLINSYLMKESSKRYFNTTRLSAQARIGWGHFSVYGTYQITPLFKDGVAAVIRPYSIGLTLSGL